MPKTAEQRRAQKAEKKAAKRAAAPVVEMERPTGVDIYAGTTALTSFSDAHARRYISLIRDSNPFNEREGLRRL
jgi:hypothetical protein